MFNLFSKLVCSIYTTNNYEIKLQLNDGSCYTMGIMHVGNMGSTHINSNALYPYYQQQCMFEWTYPATSVRQFPYYRSHYVVRERSLDKTSVYTCICASLANKYTE